MAAKRPFQTNIVIQIDTFDTSAPNGGMAYGTIVAHPHMEGERIAMRLNTEEESVAMRTKATPAQNAQFFKRRFGFTELANGFKVGKNEIPPMELGSLVLCTDCVRAAPAEGNEGVSVWRTQYLDNYSPTPDSSVIHGLGRVNYREYNGKTSVNLDVLRPDESREIRNMADLAAYYTDEMDPINAGGPTKSPITVLRVVDFEKGTARASMLYTWAKTDTVVVDGEEKTVRRPGDPMENFMAAFVDGSQGKGFFQAIGAALDDQNQGYMNNLPDNRKSYAMSLRNAIKEGRVGIEVIPGQRIDIIGSSLEQLENPKSKMYNYASRNFANIGTQAEPNMVAGFRPMTVGIMLGKSLNPDVAPGVIVTKFSNDAEGWVNTPEMISTHLWTPDYSKARAAESVRRDEQAAAVGGIERSANDDNPDYQNSNSAPEPVRPEVAERDNGPGM